MSLSPDTNTYSATGSFTVTPSDSTTFTTTVRSLYVAVTGDVKVRMLRGMDQVYTACPAGLILPVEVDRVYATGTTASSIVAMY